MSQDQVPTVGSSQPDRWLAVLDRYGVQFLVVNKQCDSEMLDVVRSRPGWGTDFEDEESALFSRLRVPEDAEAADP
jgi:hypothetical protein